MNTRKCWAAWAGIRPGRPIVDTLAGMLDGDARDMRIMLERTKSRYGRARQLVRLAFAITGKPFPDPRNDTQRSLEIELLWRRRIVQRYIRR